MNRWLAILFLLPLVAWADTPITNQSRFSFETGVEWQYVDTTSLLSATEGSLISSWSLSAADATNRFKYSTTRPYNLPRRYTVDGATTNTADTGTRGLAVIMEVTTAERYLQANLAANQGKLAGGFAFENNFTTEDFSNCDFFKLHNGSADAVIQYRTYSPLAYRTHTGSPSLVGPDVGVTSSQTNVWITFKFDNSAGVTNFTFAVYDRDSRTLIGASELALTGASYPAVADIRISNDSHSSATVQRTNRVDNFILTTNVAAYPILPWLTNVYYVDKTNGSDSNSGRSPAKAWATIGQAEATIGAGETVFIAAGQYDEAVTFDADGSSGNPRRFIAATNVVCRNFIVTGDYTLLRGFEFTKIGVNTNVTPIVVNDCTGVEILENYFHDTGHGTSGGEGGGLRYGNATNFIVRGNTFSNCGTNGSTTTASNSKDIADYNAKTNSQNVLIEYNRHTMSAEYQNLSGERVIVRNAIAGPSQTNFWPVAHIDFLQANSHFTDAWVGDNWHVDNVFRDAHFAVMQYGYSYHVAFARNVSIRSGDTVTYLIGEAGSSPVTTNMYFTGLLIVTNSIGPANAEGGARSLGTARPIYFAETSNNVALNNAFNQVTTGATPYQLGTGGSVTTNGDDLMWTQGTPTSTLLVSDPLWVSPSSYDYRPQSGSPLVDSGSALTTTDGTGSSATVVTVGDASWFHAGAGLTRGSEVYVSTNNNLYVTAVDRAERTITVNSAISWASGANVGYAYRGSGPDIGAYEYGDTLLTSATISSNTTTPFPVYTVTPTGDARFVQFFADGVPQSPDYDSPYTYTVTAGEAVTAKAFALRAQPTNEVTATAGAAGSSGNRSATVSGTFRAY